MLRSRNKIDVQIVNDAVKGYVKRKEKNFSLLNQYAEPFGIVKACKAKGMDSNCLKEVKHIELVVDALSIQTVIRIE